jgi:hypothetical protein
MFGEYDMSCRDNVLNAEDAKNTQEVVGKLWESCGIEGGCLLRIRP